jgi:hypothetical protein
MITILPWIAQAAALFAVRQVAKYGLSINWTHVRVDVTQRVEKLMPGDMLDKAAVTVAMTVVDKIQTICTSADALAKLTKLALDGKWDEALKLVEGATLVLAPSADIPKECPVAIAAAPAPVATMPSSITTVAKKGGKPPKDAA